VLTSAGKFSLFTFSAVFINQTCLENKAKYAIYVLFLNELASEVRGYVSADRYLRISAIFCGYG